MALEEFCDARILLAEDEELFRDVAEHQICEIGKFPEDNLLLTEDGIQAEETLYQLLKEEPERQIVLILDVRMPRKDGPTVAQQFKAKRASGEVRAPNVYVVCCSSTNREMEENPQAMPEFDMSIPKNFNVEILKEMMGKALSTFSRNLGGSTQAAPPSARQSSTGSTQAAPPSGGYAATSSSSALSSKVEVLVADDEMICRLSIIAKLSNFDDLEVDESDDQETTLEKIAEGQSKPGQPFMLLLGNPLWMDSIFNQQSKLKERAPFIVNTSMVKHGHASCHAALKPDFKPHEFEELIEKARMWFSKKGTP